MLKFLKMLRLLWFAAKQNYYYCTGGEVVWLRDYEGEVMLGVATYKTLLGFYHEGWWVQVSPSYWVELVDNGQTGWGVLRERDKEFHYTNEEGLQCSIPEYRTFQPQQNFVREWRRYENPFLGIRKDEYSLDFLNKDKN